MISRIVFSALVATLLAGCDESPRQRTTDNVDTDGAGDSVTGTVSGRVSIDALSLTVSKPWSAHARHDGEQRTLVATISHDENYLTVWSIDNDRKIEELGREDTGFHPDGVRWIDWNGDGDHDEIILTVEGVKEIQLWSYGFWGLRKQHSFGVTDPPQTIVVNDLDNDDNPDVILGPYDGDRITVLWGQGEFRFEQTFIDARPSPTYPKVIDWNGDGAPDVIWSDWEAGSIQVALNEGGRRFRRVELAPPQKGAPRQVEPVDLNDDGLPDLIVTLEVGKSARIFYNDGNGGFSDGYDEIAAPVVGYSAAAVTEQNGEQLLALSESDLLVLARRGADGWQRRSLPGNGLMMDLQFLDVDRDGHEDLLYANTSGEQVDIVFGPLWEAAQEVTP